jgi:GNAT superfamily N-acetyltransferase
MRPEGISSLAIIYSFSSPDQLPEGHFEEVCRLVEAGGGVNPERVRYNLKRAFLIARAEKEGVLVGTSSLKRPRPEYVQRIKDKLGLDIHGFLERGYTSIMPEYRGLGIGTDLLGGLTSRAEGYGIYSLIREDDRETQTIALRNHTVKVATFYSELTGKDLGLWMPANTAEEYGLAPLNQPQGGEQQ